MKKKLAFIMTAALAIVLLTGCGGKEGPENKESSENNKSNEAQSVVDMQVEDYVTIGEYKGLNITVPAPSVTDEDVEAHMQLIYNSKTKAENGITDRAVALGDTVNIDYEGRKDDVAFAGGTAADQELTIGSGRFIDGFEEGLVGVMPGETVDLNLTFPEDYGNEELNGQAVVFTVTVNFIYPSLKEYTDETVSSWEDEDFATVEELRQFSYDYLYETEQTNHTYMIESAVMQAFIEQCEFKELPKEFVAQYRAIIQENIEFEASMYGTDAETWSAYGYGMDLETFLDTYSVESARQVLAFQAVANKEGLTMTDEELETKLLELAAANGYNTVDEFIGTNTREEYKEYYMFEDVLAFLIENAVVTTE